MTRSLSQQLNISLGITELQLERLIQRSPNTYKTYPIPKRSGGFRIIAQPAKETKFIQYWLITNVFSNLLVHDCATAYKPGASIAKNASIHQRNAFLSKFDFKDFFGSITYEAIFSFFCRELSASYSEADLAKMARVSCIKHEGRDQMCLSIGAPSSPLLSNAIMRRFDEEVFAWAGELNLAYSRYADDLTFSGNTKNLCTEIDEKLRLSVINLTDVQLAINDKKTIHLSKKHQRRITGVVLNNNDDLSLGRERKREISAMLHRFTHNRLPDGEIFRLQGLLGFAADLEPSFIASMNRKYGNQILCELFKKRTEKLGSDLGLWIDLAS